MDEDHHMQTDTLTVQYEWLIIRNGAPLNERTKK